ncbi:hypothetical protein Q7F20_18045, partial [Curtobacterium sp. A7_M15]|uniref:hypothetical protein n=1 Tax=Curtobacterium sp. A7_M15 TaxID=3065241 RepID=UPI002737E63E
MFVFTEKWSDARGESAVGPAGSSIAKATVPAFALVVNVCENAFPAVAVRAIGRAAEELCVKASGAGVAATACCVDAGVDAVAALTPRTAPQPAVTTATVAAAVTNAARRRDEVMVFMVPLVVLVQGGDPLLSRSTVRLDGGSRVASRFRFHHGTLPIRSGSDLGFLSEQSGGREARCQLA